MMKKTDVKLVAMVVGGVVLAGYLMNALSDIGVIADARRGFDA